MDVLKFGLKHYKRNIPLMIVAIAMSFLGLTADLLLPMLTALFINLIIQTEAVDSSNIFSFLLNGKYGEVHTFELFWHIAIIFIALLLFKQVMVYSKNLLNQVLGLRLETDLRILTFDKLMELDSTNISNYNTGELLTIINSDTIMFKELFCRMIPNIFDSIFVLVVAVILLAGISPWLLLIPVILAPFFATALLKFRKHAKANFTRIRACNSVMNLTVQENIEAVRLVRSFTNEEKEKEKFDTSNDDLKEAYISQVKLSSGFEAVFSIIKQAAYIGSIAVSAVLVIKGYMLIGYLVACTDYVSRIMNYITVVNNALFQMQQQLVSGHKMLNFMNTASLIPDGNYVEGSEASNSDESAKNSGCVVVYLSINHASMVLDGVQVLADINLSVPQGKKVGIVGGTGSGKSLLLESLIRVHDMTSGEVTLNGHDNREFELENLRENFAYVFQDVFLFSNTIDSNIAYSQPDIERQYVEDAAKHAQAHGFIRRLTDGYETIVGERGIGISGGQKQRVSIARALLKDAPVLVLDDSTSALDVETEKRLLSDIKKYYPHKTLLITAHRLSTVVDCDEILYLQDGHIIERGTFDELMAINGHFAQVYMVQQAQQSGVVDFDALSVKSEKGGTNG